MDKCTEVDRCVFLFCLYETCVRLSCKIVPATRPKPYDSDCCCHAFVVPRSLSVSIHECSVARVRACVKYPGGSFLLTVQVCPIRVTTVCQQQNDFLRENDFGDYNKHSW